MGAKDIYFSMEEKWYNTLDKIDTHVPIYNVIDRIDEVIPSFALFLIIIVMLILLMGISLIAPIGGGQAVLRLMIVDNAGQGVSGAQITLSGTDEIYYSNSFGAVDDIAVPLGHTINLTVSKDDKTKTFPLRITELEQINEIRLPIDRIAFSSRTISFVDEYGRIIRDELNVDFSCSSGNSPDGKTLDDGLALVDVASDCGTLTVTVNSEKYETRQVNASGSSTTITLIESISTITGNAYVTLTHNGANISEPVEVRAYRSNNRYEAVETKSVSNGQAVFELPKGDYIFETKQEYDYRNEESNLITITETNNPTVEIELEKTVLGKVQVVVRRGLSRIEDALVTIRKGTSSIENELTDSNGYVEFNVAEEGPYTILVTKEGYCAAIGEADIDEEITIRLETDYGSCGGELKVKVLDQDKRAVQYARAIIFGETNEDSYRLGYSNKTTDYNGEISWEPVNYTQQEEKYRVFAYKGAYSGWSDAKEFSALSQEEFTVNLEIPNGIVNVNVKDKDDKPLQFAEVQLFEDYGNGRATGKRIIEEANGLISFDIRSGQRVYAVVSKEGYETYTTLPKQVIGAGTINFDVTLSRPPINELLVEFSGLFKNDKRVLKAQPGEEYTAVFEITAPKRYDELGFFVRVGSEKVSKTELDSLYIKELIVPGKLLYNGDDHTTKGSSYNPPNGYNIDSDYLGLEESKWAQAVWDRTGYSIGKIKVGAQIKIKDNAKQNEQLEIAYRVFGYDNGYERDPEDVELGTTSGGSSKQSLYAQTKKAYAWIGTETLCEKQGDNSFCITSTITDSDGITSAFDTSFNAKNNADYDLAIKVLNASTNFDITKIKLENNESNLFMNNYTLIKPNNAIVNGSVNGYETNWIENGAFARDTEFAFSKLELTPTNTGFGTLLMRIRDSTSILFEKAFNVTILSSKQINVEYMIANEFVNEIPHVVSGKKQNFTLKAIDEESELEIDNAKVKLYDRFGTKIDEKTTNKLGVAVLEIPASLPGERLKINIEKENFETKEIKFNISEDIVTITPEQLSFTVNPQTKEEERKTVKIENKTGFDLKIKDIRLVGKFKGLLSESQIESWFNSFKGKTIKANDYEEIDFKIVVGKMIPAAEDLSGVFKIIVGNEYNLWEKEIPAKIRVGLGGDVDTINCLEATLTSWQKTTQGGEVQVSFEIRNNCTVDGQPVKLKNLGAQIESTANTIGKLSAQSTTAYSELSKGYTRVFKPTVLAEEVVPVTVKFTPYGGASGQTSGTIVFQAKNTTSSKDQVLETGLDYVIDIMGSDCLVIGTDLIRINDKEGEASFTISNECTSEATFTINSKLSLSNKTFILKAGSSRDIVVNRTSADLPGAYNNLIYSRIGNGKQELIGNVKAILEDEESCFSLSRYEFDVYDSPFNDFDGTDRSYLKNSCIQKNVTVQVSGEEDYDWDKLLRDMLVGGVSGLVFSKGKILPDWMKKWTEGEENVSKGITKATTKLMKRTREEAAKKVTESGKKATLLMSSKEAQEAKAILTTVYKSAIFTTTQRKNKNIEECNKINNSAQAKELISVEKLNSIKFAGNSGEKEIKWIATIKQGDKIITEEIVGKYKQNEKSVHFELTSPEKYIPLTGDVASSDLITFFIKSHIQNVISEENEKISAKNKTNTTLSSCYKSVLGIEAKEIIIINDKYAKATEEIFENRSKKLEEITNKLNEKLISASDQLGIETKTLEADMRAKYAISALTTDDVEEMTEEQAQRNTNLINAQIKSLIEQQNEIVEEFVDGTVQKEEETKAKALFGWNSEKITINNNQHKKMPDTFKEITTPISATNKTIHGAEELKVLEKVELETKDIKQTFAIETTISPTLEIIPTPKDPIIYTSENLPNTIPSGTLQETFANNPSATYKFPNNGKLEIYQLNDGAYGEIIGRYTLDEMSTPKIWRRTNNSTPLVGQFLLATRTRESSGGSGNDNISNAIFYNMINVGAGAFGGSAVGGALLTGVLSILQGQDLGVEYNETFALPLVEIINVALESPDGIEMEVGEKTFDYDDYYGRLSQGGGQTTTSQSGGYLYNPQAMSATLGLTELIELTFIGKEGLVNESPYHPFTGILTVTGEENVYFNEYDYQEVKSKGSSRGASGADDDKGFFEGIINPGDDIMYGIEKEDLDVEEVRTYEKKFHLLFNSYEYVECGPNTYPCPPTKIGNCQVGSKTGSTGINAVPRMLLNWEWTNIDAELCDESNPDYKYCDTTQATIATMKKVLYMKDFFKSNMLTQCPQAIDIAGTKTQALATNAMDVAITSIRAEEITEGAKIEVRVETNNNLELGATVNFNITRDDGSIVGNSCGTEKRFVSNETYECIINTSQMGTGKFNVTATLDLDLCEGCVNSNTQNDSISSTILIGSQGQQECLDYKTTRTYFEKVMSANNVLDDKALDYIEFTINLTRDSFSQDFKHDLDAYLMQFLAAPVAYKEELRELFLSEKFNVEWPTYPESWKPGKYNARLVIEFANESWSWNDNNDIKSITLKLEPWADPDPYHSIYQIGFNGMVGINTDNGRNGYGVNYAQLTEKPLVIVNAPNRVSSITNPMSNAVSTVNVSVDDSFYNLNSTRQGNVLTIARTGENVSLIISPSIPVPLIFDITRKQSLDAYGYYRVEVDGEPQLTGSSMVNWTGIGEGCVDFGGASMTNWINSPDLRDDSGQGYGLRWNNVIASGTASFYGVMYVPEDSIARIEVVKASEEAIFESTFGTGDTIIIDKGKGITTIKDVFNAVEDEKICVIGGEYFWNNGEIINNLIEEIRAREATCMALTN